MFTKSLKTVAASFMLVLAASIGVSFAYEVPRQDSKTKYFYLFGPQGNPLHGKESDEFNLFVDVSEDTTEDVVIKVFDPEVAGKLDEGPQPIDTVMEFSVSGSAVLDKMTFGSDSKDGETVQFGPYKKEQGQKVGSKYRFTLTAKALSGDDLNLFNVRISPNTAEASAEKFTFVLLPNKGDKMYFYPEIPAGIEKIIVRNFDLDSDGGVSRLTDAEAGKVYTVSDSTSGQWAETEIPVSAREPRRLEYRVTTTDQDKGHAGLQFKDDKGQVLPIYFKKGQAPRPKAAPVVKEEKRPEPVKAPVNACNRFVFDATQSYDENNDKITYAWDFGDGNTSTEPTVAHVYQKGGAYRVTLKVTDNSGLECNTAVTSQQVDVNTPPKAAMSGPDLSCVGKEITFDASATSDDQPANLSYTWAFSDGTQAKGATVTKAFEKGGVYDVVLYVDDNAGTACSQDSVRQTIRVNTPPVADAGKDVTVNLKSPQEDYRVVFDGSRSYDADKNNLSYRWDLGDGTTAEGARVEHVYKNGGAYTAHLSVNDNTGAGCDTASDSVTVNLNKAPVADAGQPQQACQGQSVAFDGSKSYGEAGENLTYNWNFGDGHSGTGAQVEHNYEKSGNYQVSLVVDDGKGTPVSQSVDMTAVTINGRPTAVLSGVEKACVSDALTFDASQSSDPDGDSLKYSWDFGDGTVVEGKSKASYQYKKGGTYRVTVSVDDGKGGGCSKASDTVTVKINTPPQANVGPNLVCCQEQSSPFDGSASTDPDGDTLTYSWNFGDGSVSSDAKTQHSYAKSGLYQAVLTVNDNSGTVCSQSSAGFTAQVNAKPVPVIQVKQK